MRNKSHASVEIDMSDMFREFIIENDKVWECAKVFIESNRKMLAELNTPIRLTVSTKEEKRRERQNRYYFGIVLKSIEEQAWVSGKRFTKDAWHELLANQFGEFVEIELPDGNNILKRLSTTEMSVKRFAKYITEVTAYACSEFVIHFPAPDY